MTPKRLQNVKEELGDRIEYADGSMNALDGVHALAINTEWDVFRHPDFEQIKAKMRTPVVFDGRNLYDPAQMKKLGFTYHSIGRVPAIQEVLTNA